MENMTWKEYMLSQGLSESEVKDVIEFYCVTFANDDISKSEAKEWEINKICDAEKWYNEFKETLNDKCINKVYCNFIVDEYLDKVSFDKFCMNYAEYLMDVTDAFVCYCPSTKRIIFFR